MQETRRLQKYGVTQSELERYGMALLRDAEQAADQADSIPNVEMLDYTMESIGLEHAVMDQRKVPTPSPPPLWVGGHTTQNKFSEQTHTHVHRVGPLLSFLEAANCSAPVDLSIQ